jgi:hypothetical protein
MDMLENILGVVLVLIGIVIVGGNYYRQIMNFINRHTKDRGWSSPIPFVGPLFIIMGYSMMPFDFWIGLFWVIVLDPDTMLTLLSLPYFFIAFFRK